MREKPIFWKSLKSDNQYPYQEYSNHGWGGIKNGYKDLPSEEYPFEIIHEKISSNKELFVLSWLKEYEAPTFLECYLYNKYETNSLGRDKEWQFPDEFDLATYKTYINFMFGPISAYLNKNGIEHDACPEISNVLIKLSVLVTHTDLISFSVAANKLIPEIMNDPTKDPYDTMVEMNLIQNSDESEIEIIVDSVISKYPEKVEEYKKGKTSIANMFVGEVMRAKKGLAPKTVSAIIEKKLSF